jgi:C4-dicarboxylate transporter DctQ subunit
LNRFDTTAVWLRARAENAVAMLLLSMFVSFLLQILFRRVLGWSVGWTVEWVTIAWLWGILFGFAFVVRDSDVIRMDIVYVALPSRWRRVCDVVTGLLCAGVFLWTLPASWDYITFMGREKTAFMRWPFDLVFSVYLAFAVSVIARSLYTAWRGFMGSPPRLDTADTAENHDYD